MTAEPVYVMQRIEDLWDHIAFVVHYAPQFPIEPDLLPEQQMTLDMAFEQLHQGVEIAYAKTDNSARKRELHEVLDRALADYRAGDRASAAARLNEFEGVIFTPDGKKRGDTTCPDQPIRP